MLNFLYKTKSAGSQLENTPWWGKNISRGGGDKYTFEGAKIYWI